MAGGSSFHNNSRRGRTAKRRTTQLNSTINVTPLVDVMLVLMVIFMIAAPMLSVGGISVDLPKVTSDSLPNDNLDEPLIIGVDKDQHFFLQETRMSLEQIQEKLMAISRENPELRVYLKADQQVSYGQVLKIMTVLSKNGLKKVALVTEQDHDVPTSQPLPNQLLHKKAAKAKSSR